MASFLIHVAVANEINKKINKKPVDFLIGSIAPDLSKIVGDDKIRSHFLDKEGDVPNVDRFLYKYKRQLYDDFVLGYYVHLYTDYLWFKYFIPEILDEEKNMITKLDGTVVNCHGQMAVQYIYNDYTNLNSDIIKQYKIDTDLFYKELPKFKELIEEIPMDKLDLLQRKAANILEESKKHKDMVFNMDNVNEFIELCVTLILANLKEINAIK